MRMNGQVKNQRVLLRCQSVGQWQPTVKCKKKENKHGQHIRYFIKLYSSIMVQLKHNLCEEVFPHLLWKYRHLSIIPYGVTYNVNGTKHTTRDRWTNTVSTLGIHTYQVLYPHISNTVITHNKYCIHTRYLHISNTVSTHIHTLRLWQARQNLLCLEDCFLSLPR